MDVSPKTVLQEEKYEEIILPETMEVEWYNQFTGKEKNNA